MTTHTEAPQQPPQAPLNSLKDLFLSALPPLKTAIKVLRSHDPLEASGQENHSWLSMFMALSVLMMISMLVILASDGAPFVNPVTSLWTNKFEFNVIPSRNWPVLLHCATYAIGACATGYLTSRLAGLGLTGEVRATREKAIRLAGYAALGAAFTYVITLLLIAALGWMLYALKFTIFIFGWMTMAAVVVLPVTTWGMMKIFRRTPLPRKSDVLLPLTISIATIMACAIGAISIMNNLNEALLKQGRTVNSVRGTPTAAVVQTCARVSMDVVCAVTLYPTKWQDYELIGDWMLGNAAKPNDSHQAHFRWHPAKETDRQFALITLESRKDITIEIRIAANLVCKPDGTNIANNDQFFAVQGRVLGEQHTAPQEMRLRIDNTGPGFAEMMEQACRSQVVA